MSLAIPLVTWVVTGLDPSSIHVRFVVDKVALEWFNSEYIGSICQYYSNNEIYSSPSACRS